MISSYIFSVEADLVGERIDKVITVKCELNSRSAAQKLLEEGAVKSNGIIVTKNYKVREGDKITVQVPEAKELEITAENIPLDIRYEDSDLLVVNKPKDMVVHPAAGNYDGTLVNALMYHCKGSLSGINGVIRPGIVHRIDKDTSGLLMVAKNNKAHEFLSEQIKNKSAKRNYIAIVHGNFEGV